MSFVYEEDGMLRSKQHLAKRDEVVVQLEEGCPVKVHEPADPNALSGQHHRPHTFKST